MPVPVLSISVGGWVALAAIIVIGPRMGRFGKNARPIQGHNIPMSTLGALILGFGWFGFNGGSTLAMTDQVPRILMNTLICGVFGGLAAVIYSWLHRGFLEVRYLINGFLAGLVASTAGCYSIDAFSAMIIGLVGGLVAIGGALLLVRLKIDDAIDAVSTHAFAGAWSTLSVALFADEALLSASGGRWELFQIQLLGVVVCCLWAFGVSWVLFKIIARIFDFRVSRDDEILGLNMSEHGATLESLELLRDMETHSNNGDFSSRVFVEPHTEIGQIAQKYNDVLEKVERESNTTQKAVDQAHKHIEILRLITDVTKQINISESKNDALKSTLNRIYEYTGWAFGHAFIVDHEKQKLVSSKLHFSCDKSKLDAFLQATEALEISGGSGVIGRTYDSGASVWLANVGDDPYFLRRDVALESGLHAVFAFPVWSANKVVAVIELYSFEILEADPGLLGAMCEIGVLLGRSFERSAARAEQARVERELSLAQKLESVGRLAAGVAHEINTPAQYVSDNTRFLEDAFNDLFLLQKSQTKLLEAAQEGGVDANTIAEVNQATEDADLEYLMNEIPLAISQALDGTARISKIVGAMKQFSHPGVDTKQAVNINDTLDSTLTVSSNEWKYVATIEKDFEIDLPPVFCLPAEIGQVFLNLIVNASHAIADHIKDNDIDKGIISVTTRQLDDDVEIRISDNGPGIPESSRDKLFDAFFTTKEVGKGTGQGLSIVRSVVVNQHGGSLDFETEVGVGTTFIIRLPIANEQAVHMEEAV